MNVPVFVLFFSWWSWGLNLGPHTKLHPSPFLFLILTQGLTKAGLELVILSLQRSWDYSRVPHTQLSVLGPSQMLE